MIVIVVRVVQVVAVAAAVVPAVVVQVITTASTKVNTLILIKLFYFYLLKFINLKLILDYMTVFLFNNTFI